MMRRARRPLPASQLSRSQKVFTSEYQRRQARNAFTARLKLHTPRRGLISLDERPLLELNETLTGSSTRTTPCCPAKPGREAACADFSGRNKKSCLSVEP